MYKIGTALAGVRFAVGGIVRLFYRLGKKTSRYNRLVVERQGEELIYQAILDTDEEYSSTQVDEIMKTHKFIRSIERYDDN